MTRYEGTIRWSMYGHVHNEQYQVQRDVLNREPIGMNFIVGSVTTFGGLYPSFDILYLDPDTMLPIDMITYRFNLDEANKGAAPIWEKNFDYRKEYNLKDMSPASFMEYSKLMYSNETAA